LTEIVVLVNNIANPRKIMPAGDDTKTAGTS